MKNNSKSCDLLLFGECFLQGFEPLTWKYETDKNIAIKIGSEAFLKLKQLAKEYQTALGFG